MEIKKESPFRRAWYFEPKMLTQGVVLITTIVGSAWGAASYIGGTIYHFAEVQTVILTRIQSVQAQLNETKIALVESGKDRDKAIAGAKNEIIPRIEKLEDAVHDAEREASAAKARADDLKEDLSQIKTLSQQNLTVAKSHDEDIKATRKAVAPIGGGGRGVTVP